MKYPTCSKSFNNWLLSGKKYEKIYRKLGSPKLFDVSLRDGIQGLSKGQQSSFNLEKKTEIYKTIKNLYEPPHFEIGSFVSRKYFPIMNDVIPFFDNINNTSEETPKLYLLIPAFDKLVELYKNYNITFDECNNFSLITSCSFGFQVKNTNKTLIETKIDLKQINNFLIKYKKNNDYNVKLYISCIDECPITGKIDKDFIVSEIMFYYMNYKFNNICLSDTLGTLSLENLKYILENCIFSGLNIEFISLHLHFKENDKEDEERIKNLLFYAFEKNIKLYDVSYIKHGGCTMTVEDKKLRSNLTYELFYRTLVDHIINVSNNECLYCNGIGSDCSCLYDCNTYLK